MKATYAQKITRKHIVLTVGLTLIGMVFGIVQLVLSKNIIMGVFWTVYPGIYTWLFLSRPAVKINERDMLVFGGFPIDIHRIISLEEGKKQGIKVRYLLQEMERTSATICVSDKDMPRLLADLLSINPGIEIKAESLLPLFPAS